VKTEIFPLSIKLVLEHVASFLPHVQDNISMANGTLGQRNLFYGRLTNSGTKLIFRIIEVWIWPTRKNSRTNL